MARGNDGLIRGDCFVAAAKALASLMGWAPLTGKTLAGIEDPSAIDKILQHLRNPVASPAVNGLLFCADARYELEKTTTHTPANLLLQCDGGVGCVFKKDEWRCLFL